MAGKTIVLFSVVSLIAAAVLPGCATVRPWEKEKLGYPIMKFVSEQDSLVYEQHMLNTREASSGAYGGSGGGCGCK